MKNSKEILAKDIWNEEKKSDLKKLIISHSQKQSDERKVMNELLLIQFKIEDYIQNDNNNTEVIRISDFVKMYLKILNVTQKNLATLFEMRDSNLHKYLVGERKLNAPLVLKLSSFSHTSPEHWYRIQVKNELIELGKEKEKIEEYKKYDYRNLVKIA
jgi:plasmid maintenance system antidote protein VapI